MFYKTEQIYLTLRVTILTSVETASFEGDLTNLASM